MISTNQLKNGNHIEVDGTVFKVLEFQHVNPGKGAAFVRTKLRRTSDGNVIDKTFRAGEKFRSVRTEVRRMQFLYADGQDAHFMDSETYEQFSVPEVQVADELLEILAGLRREQGMKHHSLLHRGQLVDVFEVRQSHDWNRETSLSNAFWSSLAFGKSEGV